MNVRSREQAARLAIGSDRFGITHVTRRESATIVVVIKYRITIDVEVKSHRGKKYTEISWVCAPTADVLVSRGSIPIPADGGEHSAEIMGVNAAKNFAAKAKDLPSIDEIEVVITSPGLPLKRRPPNQEIYDAAFKPKEDQSPTD